MKKIFPIFLMLFAFACVSHVAQAQVDLPMASPRASVEQRIGLTDVKITYHRPQVKGRVIYGGLEQYGKVWRTGANNATVISFTDDVKINGQPLPAGNYSLHTIPTQGEWTIIFNKVADQWGSYQYDEKQDALRVKTQPVAANPPQEILTFNFADVKSDRATLEMSWSTLRVPFTIETEVTQKALRNSRDAVSKAKPDDWRTPFQAANYAYQSNVAPDEAMTWIDKSIAAKESHTNLALKARLLARAGKKTEAITLAERAIKLGKAAQPAADTAATEKFLVELRSGGTAAKN